MLDVVVLFVLDKILIVGITGFEDLKASFPYLKASANRCINYSLVCGEIFFKGWLYG